MQELTLMPVIDRQFNHRTVQDVLVKYGGIDNVNCEMLDTVWEYIKAFSGSEFVLALIASFAGAVGGAWGAQRIIERFKERELLLHQLRNTNAAVMVAFSVCNSMITIKDQHVMRLYAVFQRQKAEFADFRRRHQEGEISRETPFEIQAFLPTLSTPPIPVDVLQTLIFSELSVIGRPLVLMTTLSQTIQSLIGSIATRNALIERFRTTGGVSNPEFLNLYFGLPSTSGHHNTEYPDTIDAIHNLTEDAIFFSHLLCGDLQAHGIKILESYRTKFKDNSQSIAKPDFNKAKEAGLLPDEKNYQDWQSAFVRAT